MKIHSSHRRAVAIGVGLLVNLALFPDGHPALAEPASTNWARDVVRARVFARNLQAISSGKARSAAPEARILIEPRIVGGAVATANQNPFQVALLLANVANNRDAQFCGGSVIAPNMIATAAHCSDFVTASQVQVLPDARRLEGTGNRVGVTRITIHPSWNDQTFDNDVAVWELASSVTTPIADLAIEDGPDGGNLLVSGWGHLTEGGSGPIDLHSVRVPLVARDNCNDSNSYNGQITANMICAGLDQGGQDSCQGDSGGPLTRGLTDTVLTGIVSWGTGCARPNLFGIYTRVSQPGILQFIEQNAPAPVLPGSGSPAQVSSFGTETSVHVTLADGSQHDVWGTRKYANMRATANAYCSGLGKGPALRWEANGCGEDESAYLRFNPGAGKWEFRSSGSANNPSGFCRYALLTSVACGPQ